MKRDGSCPLPNEPRPFWVATRTYTARCEEGSEGAEGTSRTVTQQYKSYISLEHANNEAIRIAKCRAEAELGCQVITFFSTKTAYKECEEAGRFQSSDASTITIEWTNGDSLPAGAKIKIGENIFTVVSTLGDVITVEEDATDAGELDDPIIRVYPFVGSGSSAFSQEIADARAQAAADAGAAAIVCGEVPVYESTQTVELTCPEGLIGEPSSATATATSTISQEDADAKATAQATADAEAGLSCEEPPFLGPAVLRFHAYALSAGGAAGLPLGQDRAEIHFQVDGHTQYLNAQDIGPEGASIVISGVTFTRDVMIWDIPSTSYYLAHGIVGYQHVWFVEIGSDGNPISVIDTVPPI